MGFDLDRWRGSHLPAFEAYLTRVLPKRGAFAEAMSYPVFSGGKRIRPLLCLASWDALRHGSSAEPALPGAAAIELIHTYSLVHDDLPCMDDDDERRGRPTVHVRFGEASAVLVGDALLTHAFALLASLPAEAAQRSVQVLADAAGSAGMIGGQVLDMGLDGDTSTLERLTELHAKKTGRLIRAACDLGAIAAQADPESRDALLGYGEDVGLAFQLVDDVLDAEEDAGDDGPPSFVRLLGIDETLRRAKQTVERASERVSRLPNPEPLLALAAFTVQRKV
jgi:geranylgeranyl pyrophosphate synthase